MKCDYCGAPLSLEDEFCPHCGHANEQAKKHISDMKGYQKRFDETEASVNSTMRTYKGVTARLIILVVAIALMIAAIAAYTGVYSIHRKHVVKATLANKDEICANLDAYLENKDYVGFCNYYQDNYINSIYDDDDELYAYNPAYYGALSYTNVYNDLLQIACSDDPLNSYNYRELNDDVNNMYDRIQIDEDNYMWEEFDPVFMQTQYDNIELQFEGMLMVILDFSKEDAASMKDLSEARRSLLLEQYAMDKWGNMEDMTEVSDEE